MENITQVYFDKKMSDFDEEQTLVARSGRIEFRKIINVPNNWREINKHWIHEFFKNLLVKKLNKFVGKNRSDPNRKATEKLLKKLIKKTARLREISVVNSVDVCNLIHDLLARLDGRYEAPYRGEDTLEDTIVGDIRSTIELFDEIEKVERQINYQLQFSGELSSDGDHKLEQINEIKKTHGAILDQLNNRFFDHNVYIHSIYGEFKDELNNMRHQLEDIAGHTSIDSVSKNSEYYSEDEINPIQQITDEEVISNKNELFPVGNQEF